MEERMFATPDSITAEEIKEVRKQLGLTQREFAAFVQCSKATVERWEGSDKPISGPICVLISMLEKYPNYAEQVRVPEKTMPLRLWYMYREKVCTLIDVNERKREVRIKNFTDKRMFRAFGVVEEPDYEQYEEFLRSRCFPETRDKLKLVLNDLGLPFYDPFLIIEKTEGRMAEDDFWIKIER